MVKSIIAFLTTISMKQMKKIITKAIYMQIGFKVTPDAKASIVPVYHGGTCFPHVLLLIYAMSVALHHIR